MDTKVPVPVSPLIFEQDELHDLPIDSRVKNIGSASFVQLVGLCCSLQRALNTVKGLKRRAARGRTDVHGKPFLGH